MSRLVRSAALSRYAEVARSVGLDPLQMLAAVGIPRSCLDVSDSLISVDAASRLLELSATASGTDDFGLRMSEGRHLSILGPLGMAVRDSATLRNALDSMVRYMTLHSEAAIIDIEEMGSTVVIRVSLMGDPTGSNRQADEMVLGSLYQIVRELMGPAWRARRICFSHAAPKHMASHLRVFGGSVDFGCDFNGIVCELKDMEAMPPAAKPEMAQYAHEYLDALLARAPQSMMAEKVRRMLFSLIPTGRCSVDQVASHLGVDRRTIHRKLMQEGTSFSEILDEVRAGLAVQYLGQSERTVGAIAELLGFSMQSGFNHWFRTHFGCSPSAWRASAAQQADNVPRASVTTPPRQM
jgi:AraC-like DNA-binding protein